MEHVVEVENLSKYFNKSEYRKRNFREMLSFAWKGFFGKESIPGKKIIRALENISFQLQPGDVLGVIGNNGAGKSTLLKILAGVIQPSTGQVAYKGRMVSILELGAGFHPDLSGKENVYLNGSLLGLSSAQIAKDLDAIVAFSGIGEFIHQPVKYYSDGMYLRLAFSIFTHLDSDILLLDEVMGVGDAVFRQKSYDRMQRVARAGTTIIMVSHNLSEIKELCTKCLWIEDGKTAELGDPEAVTNHYLEKAVLKNHDLGQGSVSRHDVPCIRWTDGYSIEDEITLYHFGIRARNREQEDAISLTDDLEIRVEFEKNRDGQSIQFSICILNMYSTWVMVDSYGMYEQFEKRVWRKGRYHCTCTIPAGILNFGIYQLGFLVAREEKLIYQMPGLINFKIDYVHTGDVKDHLAKKGPGIVKPMGRWEVFQS